MPVNITDPFKDGAWNIEGAAPIETGDQWIPYDFQRYIKDAAWKQYGDPVVYQADKAFREWASYMVKNPRWCRLRNCRKYKYSELFELLFGRPYDKKDVSSARKISKIFAYYSTSIDKNYYDKKTCKWQTKTSYLISSKCLEKPAYSLRLRVEEMTRNGEIPNGHNMKLPKDNLTAGHARNPKIEAKKRERSEKARIRYNEYQRERKRIRAEQSADKQLGDA